MAKTTLQLIREVGYRLEDLVLSVATGAGTATTVVDTALRNHFPTTMGDGNTRFTPWVYAVSGVADNIGRERRARTWDQSISTLTLLNGFPVATATDDVFEVRMLFQRRRVLEAINSALAELNILCTREVVDTSLTTVNGQWSYTLPATQHWARVKNVEIQMNTSADYPTYPYASVDSLNWTPRRSITDIGSETWTLQFGILPMPNRTLRVFGDAYFPDLSVDNDALAISGDHERAATEWVCNYAACNLQLWKATGGSTAEVRKFLTIKEQLDKEKENLIRFLKPRGEGVVVIPGRGTGRMSRPVRNDIGYFGAFGQLDGT